MATVITLHLPPLRGLENILAETLIPASDSLHHQDKQLNSVQSLFSTYSAHCFSTLHDGLGRLYVSARTMAGGWGGVGGSCSSWWSRIIVEVDSTKAGVIERTKGDGFSILLADLLQLWWGRWWKTQIDFQLPAYCSVTVKTSIQLIFNSKSYKVSFDTRWASGWVAEGKSNHWTQTFYTFLCWRTLSKGSHMTTQKYEENFTSAFFLFYSKGDTSSKERNKKIQNKRST